ncbi:osmoprotectant uptake system permease [Formosimonas limnophila]|uniref:Osmoprotectant uptake system permease n=1 Tax=Formosimonas limnophila TaxID=1384487 RepID=A0A8J3FZP9_9BURK|nr:ABC transporter permease [Formosimonas limnophila]GHA64886.1 osmoprotectant uptake system permease [Formosimonas limnophila]
MIRSWLKLLRSPTLWVWLGLIALTFGLPFTYPLFSALFPSLDRPIYTQDPFWRLFISHIGIVAASSIISIIVGITAGWFVTRERGKEFKPLVDTTVAMGQTFPPVAVLAIAAPLIGFGATPALIALSLYGLLPIVEGAIAGFTSVSTVAREAATGLGMSRAQMLRHVEWPLAWPIILAGIRTSVTINIGTAAIASTVGSKTLGTPIIVGLTGYNTAYVIQGALLVGLLAVAVDMLLGLLAKR